MWNIVAVLAQMFFDDSGTGLIFALMIIDTIIVSNGKDKVKLAPSYFRNERNYYYRGEQRIADSGNTNNINNTMRASGEYSSGYAYADTVTYSGDVNNIEDDDFKTKILKAFTHGLFKIGCFLLSITGILSGGDIWIPYNISEINLLPAIPYVLLLSVFMIPMTYYIYKVHGCKIIICLVFIQYLVYFTGMAIQIRFEPSALIAIIYSTLSVMLFSKIVSYFVKLYNIHIV